MTLSDQDVAQQVGASLELVETIADLVSTGSPMAFTSYTVRKRRGGIREIVRPTPLLDLATKNLNRAFLSDLPYRAPDSVHGFVSGRSTRTNASQHLGARCVLRVDLEDFFPSISAYRVADLLAAQGYDEKAVDLCVKLVTVDRKLPIGLSTSPFISNLAFEATDHLLAAYATDANLTFTRYVDDLTFSPEPTNDDVAAIQQILNDAGWSVNPQKTAFMRRGGPQYVTGLYVGCVDRPRIPRKMKRNMRWITHMIDKVGYETYMEEFGGVELDMHPRRIYGYACYFAGVEPDIGYPLLRWCEDLPASYLPPGPSELLGESDGTA
jgi:RNA-directed DNA polymerase